MAHGAGASLDEALKRFSRTRDPRVREELVRAHAPLAESIARKFACRGEPLDELVQVAMIALAHAIDGYDPEHGSMFAAYAQVTIAGELKRHFRGTWRVRVPRSLQELYLRVRAAIEVLDQELGRSPTIPEIARYAGVAEESVAEAIEVGRSYRPASIEARRFGEAQQDFPELGGEDRDFLAFEDRDTVASLVDRLPERERTIIRLRFWEELSQSEIAARLDVSQMHVSRLLARSLARLRVLADRLAGSPVG